MSSRLKLSILAIAAVTVLATGGCGGTKPARFYLLEFETAGNSPQAEEDAADAVFVGLMPVVLPDYVTRPQIATRVDANRLDYAEHDRWAEPLSDNVTRVLSIALEDELQGVSTLEFPWPPKLELSCRVNIDVRRFDLHADGSAVLTATWGISAGRQGELLKVGKFDQRETFEEGKKPDYNARVAALSRLLHQLSLQIAAEVEPIVERRAAR